MCDKEDDLFAEFDEAAEEERVRPKFSEPAETIMERILIMKPNITRDTVIKLIEAEGAKAAGLLTEEAAAHLVASNLGIDLSTDEADDFFGSEEPEPKGDETQAREGTDQNLDGGSESPGKEAPADEEEETWFGEPTEEEEPETPITEGAEEDDFFAEATEEPEAEPEAEAGGFFEAREGEPVELLTPGATVTAMPSTIVSPAISPEAMRAQMKLFQRMKASLLDKGPQGDIATIQGNPYIKRSGWRKFALVFNISDEIIKEERDVHGDGFTWRIWVKTWAPNGRSVVGIGACSSEERDFAHTRHDVYATAHTRAKNRALSDLIGSGEVSWEELRGFDNQ